MKRRWNRDTITRIIIAVAFVFIATVQVTYMFGLWSPSPDMKDDYPYPP